MATGNILQIYFVTIIEYYALKLIIVYAELAMIHEQRIANLQSKPIKEIILSDKKTEKRYALPFHYVILNYR